MILQLLTPQNACGYPLEYAIQKEEEEKYETRFLSVVRPCTSSTPRRNHDFRTNLTFADAQPAVEHASSVNASGKREIFLARKVHDTSAPRLRCTRRMANETVTITMLARTKPRETIKAVNEHDCFCPSP